MSRPVAFVCDDAVEQVAAAACMARTGLDGLVLSRARLTESVRTCLSNAGFGISEPGQARLCPPGGQAAQAQAGRVSVLTSGTTGDPKLISHTWDSLVSMRRRKNPQALRWLMTYQGGTYAWFQVLCTALFLENQELVVSDERDPSSLVEAASTHGATAVSATASFWRLALLQASPERLRALRFEQITLGGERVDQGVLDQLRRHFPVARLTHIYASSEVGACIVVNDGREGFPVSWLAETAAPEKEREVQLEIRDGILWVRSVHASSAHQTWVDTGDVVEIHGDRAVIVGRRNGSIVNVGGMKVARFDVERVLLEHESVVWCRVYGRRAPLTGELMAADVVLSSPGADPIEWEATLTRYLRDRLPEYAIPRIWRLLGSIPTNDNLKAVET